MEQKHRGVIHTTFLVTLVILISKLFGFLRELVLAAKFGATAESDAYIMGYGILSVFVLMINSCTSSTIVPIYSAALQSGGKRTASRYISNMINTFGIVSLLLGLLGLGLSEPLVRIIAPGFTDNFETTVNMTRIMMPSLVFFCISNILASLLNAREQFIAPQLVGFSYSFCIIIAALSFKDTLGVSALAYATNISAVLQVLVLLPFARRAFRYTPSLQFTDERVKRTFKLALPALMGMAINEMNMIVDRSIASGLPGGSVSALNYAYRIVMFILGLLVVPITTILFSKLSIYAAKHDKPSMVEAIKQSMESLAILLLPIIGLGMVLSPEIIKFIYERGSFDTTATATTSYAFMFYIAGVFFFALRDVYTRAFYAEQNTKTPVLLAIISLILNIILDITLVKVMDVGGLALATTISGLVCVIVLLILLRNKFGHLGLRGTSLHIGLTSICALITSAFVYYIDSILMINNVLFRLVICGSAGLVAYFILLLIFRVRGVKILIDAAKRKLSRRSVQRR
jgi:putative peptidoglycan lipid II flippase